VDIYYICFGTLLIIFVPSSSTRCDINKEKNFTIYGITLVTSKNDVFGMEKKKLKLGWFNVGVLNKSLGIGEHK